MTLPVIAFRPTPEDQARLESLRALLTTREPYRPITTTDIVRFALHVASGAAVPPGTPETAVVEPQPDAEQRSFRVTEPPPRRKPGRSRRTAA